MLRNLKIAQIFSEKLDEFSQSEHAIITNMQTESHNMTSIPQSSAQPLSGPFSTKGNCHSDFQYWRLVIDRFGKTDYLTGVKEVSLMGLNLKLYEYLFTTVPISHQSTQEPTHANSTFPVEYFLY